MKLSRAAIRKAGGDFKKAWRFIHAQNKSKKGAYSMARKYRKAHHSSHNKKSGFLQGEFGNVLVTSLGAAFYGAFRAKTSDALSPITSKVPLGDLSDEAVMFALSFGLKKILPSKFKAIGKAGMIIESARIGEYFAMKGLGGITTTASQFA